MSDDPANLSFERAAYVAPRPSATPCSGCKTPLAEEYWKWQRLLVCGTCRQGLEDKLKKTRSRSVFLSALLKGGATAFACGVAYAIFVGLTDVQIAFATIGIAIAVATVIRKATDGVSGRRYQILAVALTYGASTMGYAPAMLAALRHVGTSQVAATSADATSASTPAASRAPSDAAPGSNNAPTAAATAAQPAPAAKGSLFGLVWALLELLGLMLALPFLSITDAPLGAVIVAIGLWSAWRRTAPVPLQITGPYRVAAPAPPAPAASIAGA